MFGESALTFIAYITNMFSHNCRLQLISFFVVVVVVVVVVVRIKVHPQSKQQEQPCATFTVLGLHQFGVETLLPRN